MNICHEHRSEVGRGGRWHRRAPLALLFALSLLGGASSGCAALTNPLAEAVPVRRLPPELLAPSKDEEQTIPLPLLGQPRPLTYRLAAGDVLGVYIEGVLGERAQPPLLHVPPLVEIRDQHRLPPAVGYPVPVRPDGTIVLPLLETLSVQGMSLEELEEALRKLIVAKEILQPGKVRITLTLLNPRDYEVVVLRQESNNTVLGPAGEVVGSKRSTGHVVYLRAYQNDVLHALAETGGLPGLDAYDEVVIERGCFQDEQGRAAVLRAIESLPPGHGPARPLLPAKQIIRIPLRWPPGTDVPFHPEDVVLQTGDVVFLEARDKEVFYTGGLLPAGEHVLPRDRDLDVLAAVSQVRGPILNGAFATNSLAGNLIAPGIGGPSASQLVVVRRTPGGGEVPIRIDLNRALYDARERINVRAGDLLVLQETPGEALARYFSQTFFNFDLFWQVVHERFATGVIDVATPDRLPGRLFTTPLLP
jgi:protein involved in polysaccharide export with SLBB domain